MNPIVNKSVRILTGKYAGLVGIVEKMGENGSAKIHISGVSNGEEVNVSQWFKSSQWEVLNG